MAIVKSNKSQLSNTAQDFEQYCPCKKGNLLFNCCEIREIKHLVTGLYRKIINFTMTTVRLFHHTT